MPDYSFDINHYNFDGLPPQSLEMAYEGKFDLAGSLRSSQPLSSNAAK